MINVGILGATGYTGGELVRILSGHPEVTLVFASSDTFAGKKLAEIYPSLKHLPDITLEIFQENDAFIEKLVKSLDLVFIAYPAGKAAKIAPRFLEKGVKVIDLGADFRIKKPAVFQKWYEVTPPEPEFLEQSVYGLPEVYRAAIQQADLVANPGCYPTATLLSLWPLFKEKVIDSDVIIDAKSGVSGAGRTPKETNVFSYCNENFLAYSVEGHRHQPEIEQELGNFAGAAVKIVFQTHLVPMTRGIFVTIYVKLKKNISEEEGRAIYRKYFGGEKFVRLLPAGVWPATKNVSGSNYFDLNFKLYPTTGQLVILGVLDNLVKGASGQAVQNMNLVMGFEESLGLEQTPIFP